MLERKYPFLSQETLKLIACVTMFIDHFGRVIVPSFQIPWVVGLYYICRIIGRLSFPIYCFLVAEGMRRTRNAGKYILRLSIGILLAELPYDYLFRGGFHWGYQSVMVTLTLGAMMLFCMEKTEKSWLKAVVILFFAIAAELCRGSYGAGGIVLIAAFALFDLPLLQTVAFLMVNWQLTSSATVRVCGIPFPIQLLATFSMLPICLYNGKKQSRSPVIQWAFYLFYPVHLAILWLITRL